jgi:hypothetical protein
MKLRLTIDTLTGRRGTEWVAPPDWLGSEYVIAPIRRADGTWHSVVLRNPWPWVLRRLKSHGYLDSMDID